MRTTSRLLSAVVGGLLVLGCESTETTSRLEQAKIDFEARRYEAAHEQALLAVGSTTGEERLDAAYLAGLSAYKLGRIGEAESQFLSAINSPNRQTSGNAKAMLGLIRLNQERYVEAAQLFKEAATTLSGADARQAAQHAAVAYEAAGHFDTAETWMAIASEAALAGGGGGGGGGAVTTIAVDDEPIGEFALQVGAFHERWRADRAADEARALAENHRLGPVRIIPQHDERGRDLFVVQVGRFATRQHANLVRTELGQLQYIVTASAQGPVANAGGPLGYE